MLSYSSFHSKENVRALNSTTTLTGVKVDAHTYCRMEIRSALISVIFPLSDMFRLSQVLHTCLIFASLGAKLSAY